MSRSRGQTRIGTSGYQYDHWRGVLYEEGLPKTRWFERYAEQFDTVEINNTFYNLPEAGTFDKWRDAAPPGFEYVLKYSRYGSHMKRLKDPDEALAKFLDVAERLKSRLGPILVQLPPNWGVDVDRLAAFLKAAPKRRRWALEFRDPSWLCDEVFDLLAEHNAALCVHDMLEDHPRVRTADWVYHRFHGTDPHSKYAGAYSPQFLSAEAKRLREHRDAGRDVYAYFNNDQEGHAVRNAHDLMRYMSKD